MTVDDILARRGDDTIWFRGDEVAAFCDLFEFEAKQVPGYRDWPTIRCAAYVMGQRYPPTWLDEMPRIFIGQALGRDWYIPANVTLRQATRKAGT